MTSMRGHLASLMAFDFSNLDIKDAIRGALVTAAITAIPVMNGDPKTAIPLSIGAVFAAIAVTGATIWVVSLFAMVGDPVVSTLDARLLATVAAAVLVLVAVTFSTITQSHRRR